MSDNITALPQIEQDKLIALIEQLKRNMPHMKEMAQLVAKSCWESYRAHLEAGFSPEQAMQLCR